MSTFFHGWRRKAGCVSLVMASALMGTWERTFWATDILWMSARESTLCMIRSLDSRIVVENCSHQMVNYPHFGISSGGQTRIDVVHMGR